MLRGVAAVAAVAVLLLGLVAVFRATEDNGRGDLAVPTTAGLSSAVSVPTTAPPPPGLINAQSRVEQVQPVQSRVIGASADGKFVYLTAAAGEERCGLGDGRSVPAVALFAEALDSGARASARRADIR